jgi:hypothetical protein
MTGSEAVNAQFSPGVQLAVTVAGTGTGTVTSTPAGIDCPTTCSAVFPPNTQVSLSESPNSNDAFASWSGDCSGAASCTVTLAASGAVTANFAASGTEGSGSSSFVYVSSNTSPNKFEVEGFNAAANGQLTPVSGSPFPMNIRTMAANGKYLFGSDGVSIFSFAASADGTIAQVSTINAQQLNNPNNCGGPGYLFLDRTGTTLYDLDYDGDCANNQYQSFNIDDATGALAFSGLTTAASPIFEKALSFIGNNQYAFGASCYHYYQDIYGFRRNSDGTLTSITDLSTAAPLPAPPPGDAYCPWLAAADAGNHVAVSVTAMSSSTMQADGASQLSVYTVDAFGNLATSSTAANMPQVLTGSINDMQASPDGNYLAVAGTGLQIFRFNGGDPLTQLTALIINEQLDQVVWDQSNHLYAISNSSGKLFVFTVTAGGATQVTGSPYVVTSPVSLAVVPGS